MTASSGITTPSGTEANPTCVDFHSFAVSFPEKVEKALAEAYGGNRWLAIKRALAKPPSYTAVRVNTMRTTREKVLHQLKQQLEEFNHFHHQSQQQKKVEPFSHPKLEDVVIIPSTPSVKPVLKPSPDSSKSIIVDRLCAEAVLKGSDIYARGVMSASSGISAEDQVDIYGDLDHISTRGSAFEEHKGRKLFLGRGVCQMSRSELFRVDKGLAINQILRVCDDAPSMNNVLAGEIYLQNLPSTIVAHVLAPKPGDVVLDMCAAPGGKTSHLATLMQDQGILVCCDRSRRKALALKNLFEEQMHFKCVTPLKMDSTQSVLPKSEDQPKSVAEVLEQARHKLQQQPLQPTNQSKKQNRQKQQPQQQHALLPVDGFYPETFDKILLDPPCSALGLRPRLLHAGDEADLDEYSKMQRNFLWAAVFLLKPGGTLVYSTCTINPKENEQMVRYALDTFPLQLVPQQVHLGEKGLPNQGLNEEEANLVQRFDPSSELDTMGFFCAKFVKTNTKSVG